jgi:hypothetical protein
VSARIIGQALGGKKTGNGWLCACPVRSHGRGRGDKSPSLVVRDEPGGGVSIRCFAGCSARDVIEELKRLGAWDGDDARGPGRARDPEERARRDADDASRTARAMRVWNRTASARGSLVETYLAARGITLRPPSCLSFHPELVHGPSGTRWPAMVALVTDACGRAIGIHRTFLATDGRSKAPVDKPKMMLGSCAGGAIRLAPDGPALMVSEGIENCLAAMQATGRPGWAAGSTGFMRLLALPSIVREVTILADGDDPGERAALGAARRWLAEGRSVRIARPPSGTDFNDLLRCSP